MLFMDSAALVSCWVELSAVAVSSITRSTAVLEDCTL